MQRDGKGLGVGKSCAFEIPTRGAPNLETGLLCNSEQAQFCCSRCQARASSIAASNLDPVASILTVVRLGEVQRLQMAGLASLAFTVVGGLALILGLALVNLHSR